MFHEPVDYIIPAFTLTAAVTVALINERTATLIYYDYIRAVNISVQKSIFENLAVRVSPVWTDFDV
jgi:hypothetical protein